MRPRGHGDGPRVLVSGVAAVPPRVLWEGLRDLGHEPGGAAPSRSSLKDRSHPGGDDPLRRVLLLVPGKTRRLLGRVVGRRPGALARLRRRLDPVRVLAVPVGRHGVDGGLRGSLPRVRAGDVVDGGLYIHIDLPPGERRRRGVGLGGYQGYGDRRVESPHRPLRAHAPEGPHLAGRRRRDTSLPAPVPPWPLLHRRRRQPPGERQVAHPRPALRGLHSQAAPLPRLLRPLPPPGPLFSL
mmetsp:Transcript_6597/g.21296  ORF Transcript_6597/g.21296 Transcript_6597/m.21296 type:complete len:240 (-) Transcript_6597:163-882(-)